MRTAKRSPKLGLAASATASPERGIPVSEGDSKYQLLFDQASDAVLTILPDGRIDAVNRALEELSGYLRGELFSRPIDLLAPGPEWASSRRGARPLSRGIFAFPGTYEDVAIRRKDGYIRFVDLSVRIVSDGESRYALALFRDLTEKKRMERELITKHGELRDAYSRLERKTAELQAMQEILVQSGKMAALGELSAGIAHELNQPLQAIRGYAQELQAMAPPELKGSAAGADARGCLSEIVSSADKMASIIGYLRAFVRKSTENHELTDVHAAIEEALKMLGRQLAARGIRVDKRLAPGLPRVFANPLQLEQVFINLATNARDAIEATGRGGGVISISTRDVGKTVEITFSDDGCGMSELTRAKAFNPFFTTKEVGKGMGLGLGISYGILTKLQGSIVVRSELGKGTEFLIRIPKDYRELA